MLLNAYFLFFHLSLNSVKIIVINALKESNLTPSKIRDSMYKLLLVELISFRKTYKIIQHNLTYNIQAC